MKKLTVILALAMLIVSILPTVCFANTSATAVGVEDVYLINPISIALHDNTLFVADKITSQQSLLHAFDLTDNPVLVYTQEFDGEISKISVQGDNLFVMFENKFDHYTITQEGLTLAQNYNISAVADVSMREDKLIVFLKNGKRTNANGDNLGGFVDGNGVASVCIDQTYYWLYNRDGVSYYVTGQWVENELSLTEEVCLDSKLDGMTVANAQALFYNKTFVVDTEKRSRLDTDVDNTFVAVAGNGGNSLVTIVNKIANVYNFTASTCELTATIGSDTVKLTPPAYDKITSYTLVKPLAYPANIVYKTTDATTSIENILDDATNLTYVVLGYDGCENDEYYYVFVNDCFGWVRKSATTLDQDTKIEVIDTTVSNSMATYYGKLLSANATYLYKMPCTTANMQQFYLTTLTQTASQPSQVTILQAYIASDDTAWFFVSYTNGSTTIYGFVLQGNVSELSVQDKNATITLEKVNPHMKINASLTEGVSIYVSKDMLETNLLTDEDGNAVTLETNTKVGVITRLEDVSYVQVVYPNGTVYYGWVENHHLIELNAMTTNTVVGISFISVAILLIVTTTAIVRKRQLKKQNPIVIEEE